MSDINGWDVIFSYSRKQAIEEGVLVDVSEVAKEAGFRYPVAVTAAVWAMITDIPESRSYQDIDSRLWDVIYMAVVAISKNRNASEINYDLILDRMETRTVKTKDGFKDRQVLVRDLKLKMVCSPGDEGEPVITIMLPNED
jgi:septum formation inhibitor-activating ATPase MinD